MVVTHLSLTDTGVRGQICYADLELEEEAMKSTNRTVAFRVIGTVVAGILAVGMTSAPADAAAKNSGTSGGSSTIDVKKDTGWE